MKFGRFFQVNIILRCLFLDCFLAQSLSFFQDVTSSVFGSGSGFKGYVAAFGDINNDKHTDIFIISEGSNVTVLLGGSEKQPTLRVLQSFESLTNSNINSIIPADFNGDKLMDVILTHKEESKVKLEVFWGSDDGIDSNNAFFFDDKPINDQPLLLDANGDMIPDLLVSYPNSTRAFWLGHKQHSVNWTFNTCDFTVVGKPILKGMRVPHSNAFLDLTGEGTADLFVTSTDNLKTHFEIWQGGKKGMTLANDYKADNATWSEVGQSVFADVDGDGRLDHLLPVCTIVKGRCTNSKIVVYKNKLWVVAYQASEGWNFVARQNSYQDQPITLVVGDYNQDVFIDILCVMEQSVGNKPRPQAVLLYGGKCLESFCKSLGRMFTIAFSVPAKGAFSAAFYDLQSDGTLDFLVSTSQDGSTQIHAYRNTVAEDVSFLIVKVLPGIEQKTSTNTPGPCVSYKTTNTEGGTQLASVCQLSQSAYLSVQLPYASFGLGRLPNFVDSLTATIPTSLIPCDDSQVTDVSEIQTLSSTWTMLIPNSQLFIKPYPINDPHSWSNLLLVTPGQNVITTGIVLISSCGLVIIIITILHCLEKQEDKREKIQDAHRFHFDAM